MATVAENSFLLFVYPFLFEASTFEQRVDAIDTRRISIKRRSKSEGAAQTESSVPFWLRVSQFPRDEMLAYVADYLNPRNKNAKATAQIWALNEELENVYGLFGRRFNWKLHAASIPQPIQFVFGSKRASDWAAHLMLFRDGVGFLTIWAEPQSHSVDDWLDLAHFFRFAKGQRKVSIDCEKRAGLDQKTNQQIYEPFFPLSAERVAVAREDGAVLDMILHSLMDVGTGQWWRDVFVPEQMIPFAIMFIRDAEPANDLRLANKVRNFFRGSQGDNPAPEDLEPANPGLIPYAERQWFSLSLEGGGFLAFDPPETPFYRNTLRDHLRDHYFLVMLLALHQRFKLMDLSQQVAEKWLIDEDAQLEEQISEARLQAFGEIRQAFLEFSARGYFTQVMQHEHHHKFYRKWQEIFQIKELYEEVRDEVREIHDFLRLNRAEKILRLTEKQQKTMKEKAEADAAREKRIEKRLRFVGLVFGLPALIIAFLGINLVGITTRDDGLSIWMALAISIGSGVVGGVIMMLLNIVKGKRPVQKSAKQLPYS